MQVTKFNLSASPMALQPPVPGLSSSASPSFSYNIPKSNYLFPNNQLFQSGMVRVFADSYELRVFTVSILLSDCLQLSIHMYIHIVKVCNDLLKGYCCNY